MDDLYGIKKNWRVALSGLFLVALCGIILYLALHPSTKEEKLKSQVPEGRQALKHWARLTNAKSAYIDTATMNSDDARLANETLARCSRISVADSAAHAEIVLSFRRSTLSMPSVNRPDGKFPGGTSVRYKLKITDRNTGEVLDAESSEERGVIPAVVRLVDKFCTNDGLSEDEDEPHERE